MTLSIHDYQKLLCRHAGVLAAVITTLTSIATNADATTHAHHHTMPKHHATKHWTPPPPPVPAETIARFSALEETAKEKIMLVYHITTGALTKWGGDIIGYGHSGQGAGLNNPAMVSRSNLGPTPPGTYIMSEPQDSNYLNKNDIMLTPLPGTQQYGRNHFYIHWSPHKTRGCIGMPNAGELEQVAQLRKQGQAYLLTVQP